LYGTLKQIGEELFTYFLKLYPENSIVSLCISENNFNEFLKTINKNKFCSELQYFFKGAFLANEYAILTVAVYQTLLVVRKNINNENAYNPVITSDLGMDLNQVESWYRAFQETIWVCKLSNKFKDKNRKLLLPSPELMLGHKHVRYPMLQFFIDKDKYNYILLKHELQIEKLKNMTYEEFSKRVFSSYDKYYDFSKASNYLRLKEFSNEELNIVAKKIIYSFIIDDINFTTINISQSEGIKKSNNSILKTQKSNPIILIENINKRSFSLRKENQEAELDIRDLGYKKVHLFIFDYKNSYWIHKKRTLIKPESTYGILINFEDSDLLEDFDYLDYATEYLIKEDYYFIKLKGDNNILKHISNALFFYYVEEKTPNLIGGLKNNNQEYYDFALPALLVADYISLIFINDEQVLIDYNQNKIDLNKYSNLLHEGRNIIKTKKSKLAEFNIYTPNIEDYEFSINKGWYFYDKGQVTKEKDYHLNGFFITDKLKINLYDKTLRYKQNFKYNPILHLINKNIIKNIKKGNKLL